MKRWPAAAVLVAWLALWAGPAWGQLKIEGATVVAPYKMVRLSAGGDTKGAAVFWQVYPRGKVDAERAGARLIFTAPPGVYEVTLQVVRQLDGGLVGEEAQATVTVGEPKPPDPVEPTDAWLRPLQDAYNAEPAEYPRATGPPGRKADHLPNLASLYSVASNIGGTVSDPSLAKLSDLSARMRSARVAMGIPDEEFVGVRKAIQGLLNAEIGAADAPLTDEFRAKVAAAYARVARNLKGVR